MARQWSISDLHLSIERPSTLQRFDPFLAGLPQPGDHAFILGDLSDVWIGDDDTVVEYLTKYDVTRLIHGHTHRPTTHRAALPDGSEATRLVLPEWHEDRAIAWLDNGHQLTPVEIGKRNPVGNFAATPESVSPCCRASRGARARPR